MKLLVIEDSVRLQNLLKKGLTFEGFAVDVCGNGLDGLDFIQAYEYDVVILDLMLPGLDGLSLLKKNKTIRNPNTCSHLVGQGRNSGSSQRA